MARFCLALLAALYVQGVPATENPAPETAFWGEVPIIFGKVMVKMLPVVVPKHHGIPWVCSYDYRVGGAVDRHTGDIFCLMLVPDGKGNMDAQYRSYPYTIPKRS